MCRNYLSQPKKKRRWSKTYAFEVSERGGGPVCLLARGWRAASLVRHAVVQAQWRRVGTRAQRALACPTKSSKPDEIG